MWRDEISRRLLDLLTARGHAVLHPAVRGEDEIDERYPDVAVARTPASVFKADQCALAVEVGRERGAAWYAAHGVPEYWLVVQVPGDAEIEIRVLGDAGYRTERVVRLSLLRQEWECDGRPATSRPTSSA